MENVERDRTECIKKIRSALDRIRGLLSDALEAARELDAPRPVAIGVRTALRLAVAEIDNLNDAVTSAMEK